MNSIVETLMTNLKSKESDFNKAIEICVICKKPVEKDVELFGYARRVPVMCDCKKKKLEDERIQNVRNEKEMRLNQLFKNSLMDSKFKQCTFDNWDHNLGSEKIYKITKNYTNSFSEMKKNNVGLLLHGTPGNGKTYATCCVANELIEKGVTCICVSINSLLERIKETYNKYGNQGEIDVLRGLTNADLVIIDDLGTEQATEWSKTRVYNIIDSRYRNGLPLIISTNITMEKIKEIYSERTYDRILEMCTPVKNDKKSIRAEKGREKTKIIKSLLDEV